MAKLAPDQRSIENKRKSQIKNQKSVARHELHAQPRLEMRRSQRAGGADGEGLCARVHRGTPAVTLTAMTLIIAQAGNKPLEQNGKNWGMFTGWNTAGDGQSKLLLPARASVIATGTVWREADGKG